MATAEANPKKIQVQRYEPESDPDKHYLNEETGLWTWLTTVDHKKIGLMYLASITFFFFVGGIMALLVRTELWTPAKTFIEANTYNQLFTLHGAIMIFLFLVPSVPAALGNFFLPLQLGAKDVAFPRLNLLSYYIYVAGAVISIVSIVSGGIDTGWTFYTPYSSTTGGAVTIMTFGVFVIGFSSILTGVNFITTIHKMRAPGLTWDKLSLFSWSLYATSIIQILATPVLAITLALVGMERILGIGIFDPAMGGDPVLYQHFFWFYSHPAVYIMIVPGFGIVSEVITTFSKKHIFGYWAIALSSLAIAFIGFLVWGHHMFVSGQASLATMVFSFLTFLVGIPTGIKMFNWTATLYKGSIKLASPLLYIFGFFFLFLVGGLTGIVLGSIALDVHLHDTYYVVAHFHFVMVGGMVMAFLAGLHYWWPKMIGRMYNETMAKIACGIIFIGFNVTFLPQFVMGSQGMPRRYFNYIEQFQSFHQISTIGSYILGFGFVMIFYYLVKSIFTGEKASPNPWGSRALEWQVNSRPPLHNFHHTPVIVNGPYDYHKPMDEFQLGLAENHNAHSDVNGAEVSVSNEEETSAE
ncbi:cytochrome c oxidase subunit I [Fodinibius salsisoli]|uniref:Cytochrome c oxidase subunit 1 n=1 Tax=Fodinibius salsisoli TaxID=2820877 RepID=A0ABT3PSZ4_9BACT|nr:cytochrome c oxidase subunit I [Fodinibius salsisoli]MCW9708978.1 cytochrome c oxidase subunit I [Fodinibius salsisoli]